LATADWSTAGTGSLGGSARAIVGVHVSDDETSASKSELETSRALVLIMIPSRLFCVCAACPKATPIDHAVERLP
jgi:hypothetical protein